MQSHQTMIYIYIKLDATQSYNANKKVDQLDFLLWFPIEGRTLHVIAYTAMSEGSTLCGALNSHVTYRALREAETEADRITINRKPTKGRF
jgi:hypothetical protein